MDLKFYEREIKITSEREKYNEIKKTCDKIYKNSKEKFEGVYLENSKSIPNVSKENIDKSIGIFYDALDEAVKILLENKIYTYDSNLIINKFGEKLIKDYIDIYSKSFKIERQKEEDNELVITDDTYSYKGKDSLSGKIRNFSFAICKGTINSARDIGEIVSNKVNNKVSNLEVARKLRTSFLEGIDNIKYIICEILEEEGVKIDVVSEDDSAKSKNIIKNIQLIDTLEEAEIKDNLEKAMELDPFNIEIYKFSLTTFGDVDGDIEKIGDFFGINVSEIKDIFIGELFKKVNLENEDELKKTWIDFERASKYYNYTEINKYRDIVNRKLEEFDTLERTVDGVLFATRDDAKIAKGELEKINEVINTIEEETEENLKEAMEKINAMDFETNIREKYINKLQDKINKIIYQKESDYLDKYFSLIDIDNEVEANYKIEEIKKLELTNSHLAEMRIEEIEELKIQIVAKEDKEAIDEIIDDYVFLNDDDIKRCIEEIENLPIRSEKVVKSRINYLNKDRRRLLKKHIDLYNKAIKYERRLISPVEIKEKKSGIIGGIERIVDKGKLKIDEIREERERDAWSFITKNGARDIKDLK